MLFCVHSPTNYLCANHQHDAKVSGWHGGDGGWCTRLRTALELHAVDIDTHGFNAKENNTLLPIHSKGRFGWVEEQCPSIGRDSQQVP